MRLDAYTRELVVIAILFKRLGFGQDQIFINDFGNRGLGVVLQHNGRPFPISLGDVQGKGLRKSVVIGRWQEAMRNIFLRTWTEEREQALVDASTMFREGGHTAIVETLIANGALDPDTRLTDRMFIDKLVADMGKELVVFNLRKKGGQGGGHGI